MSGKGKASGPLFRVEYELRAGREALSSGLNVSSGQGLASLLGVESELTCTFEFVIHLRYFGAVGYMS